MSAVGRSPQRRTAHLVATAALALLTVTTALTFSRVFADWSFLRPLLTVALAAHGLAALGRTARLPGWLAVPGALAGVALVVAWVFHPDTLWSALPTLDTWRAARADLVDAWAQVGEAIPPVDHEGGFGVAAALSLGVAAVLADTFAFRAGGRVEALVPTGVVFVAVSAVGIDRNRLASTAVWLAVALGVVAVLRSAEAIGTSTWVGPRAGSAWRRWSAGGLALATFAGLAAAIAGPRLPGAGEEPWFDPDPSGDSATEVISPLVDIRGRLTDRGTTVLFTVTADRPAYWRLTSLPRFDGTRWGLPERALDEAAGQLADPPATASPMLQRFEVEALGGNLVPVAYAPTELRAASRDLYFVLDTATLVVSGDGLERGDSYEIVSAVPQPTADDLVVASTRRPPDPIYLELPDSFTPDLAEVARQVTVGATTPYQQALALQTWFRGFTYDLEVPSGHSTSAIRDFLERRSGYCEQFAGTFAAFARSLGLPSRVAVGFTQGQLGGDGKYRVRSLNAHAWPEVWFDEYGWVMFEPTPGRGAPGAEAHTGVPPAQEEVASEPDPATATTVAPSPASTVPTTQALDLPDGPSATSTGTVVADGGRASSLGPWVLGVLGLVLMWITLMPVTLRAWARRRSDDDALVCWRATIAALDLAGIHPVRGETFVEQAVRVAQQAPIDRRELRELAAAATTVVYSARPLDDATRHRVALIGRHLVATARSMMPWTQRLLARVDPRRAWRLTGA
jgi:transglutaminase-like putative cysteine protease